MKTLKVKLTGVSPFLMHNGRLSDPLSPIVKEMKAISGKRKKVDADLEELARLEFLGGSYADKNGCPIVPGELIEAALVNGAKKSKLGKVFKAAVFCEGDFLLKYDGPKTMEKLWKDEKFRLTCAARVQNSRIMRTRPMFEKWELIADVEFLDDVVQEKDVMDAIIEAGRTVGIGDWRPKFGRFNVEKI